MDSFATPNLFDGISPVLQIFDLFVEHYFRLEKIPVTIFALKVKLTSRDLNITITDEKNIMLGFF